MEKLEMQRVAIVTGGSQNIGLAIAQKLNETGARVVIADLSPPDGGAGDEFQFVQTDLSSQESVRDLMEHVKSDHGALDMLVNNAGICVEAAISDMTTDQWDRVFNVNARGVFLCTQYALPLMKAAADRQPAIVNVSSIEAFGANPLHSAYAASKAAVAAFTRNTAMEYGPLGIRCNGVAPGWISTPFNDALLDQYPDREKVDQEIKALHPLGSLGATRDVAETVVWLASPEAKFVNGQIITVDGGRMALLPTPKL